MAIVGFLVALVMMVGNVCRKAEKCPRKAVDALLGLTMIGIGEAHKKPIGKAVGVYGGCAGKMCGEGKEKPTEAIVGCLWAMWEG